MWSAIFVEAEVTADRCACLADRFVGSQIHLLVFDGSPQAHWQQRIQALRPPKVVRRRRNDPDNRRLGLVCSITLPRQNDRDRVVLSVGQRLGQ
jgi:hypothetical protein